VDCLEAKEETAAGAARAKAVLESIRTYHDYECDANQRLDGIPTKRDLGILDITHDAISKVHIPYCPFSASLSSSSSSSSLNATATTATATAMTTTTTKMCPDQNEKKELDDSSSAKQQQTPSLELQLLRQGITKIPPSDPRFSYNTEPTYASSSSSSSSSQTKGGSATSTASTSSWTTNELEYELWLVLDYFATATKKQLSPVLLQLLPRGDNNPFPKAWPSDFSLKALSDEKKHDAEGDVGVGVGVGVDAEKNPNQLTPVSNANNNNNNTPLYPNRRRQRRLSYSAAYLLESILPIGGNNASVRSSCAASKIDEIEIQELRALLLSIPSTRQRLRVVLEKFHQWRLYQECDEFA